MKRICLAAMMVIGIALVGGACSGDDYSKADFQADLEDKADLSSEAAKCVADGVDDAGIDFSKLNSDEDNIDDILSGEDQEKFTDATTKCLMDEAGLDDSDITVPD